MTNPNAVSQSNIEHQTSPSLPATDMFDRRKIDPDTKNSLVVIRALLDVIHRSVREAKDETALALDVRPAEAFSSTLEAHKRLEHAEHFFSEIALELFNLSLRVEQLSADSKPHALRVIRHCSDIEQSKTLRDMIAGVTSELARIQHNVGCIDWECEARDTAYNDLDTVIGTLNQAENELIETVRASETVRANELATG